MTIEEILESIDQSAKKPIFVNFFCRLCAVMFKMPLDDPRVSTETNVVRTYSGPNEIHMRHKCKCPLCGNLVYTDRD